MTGSLPECIRCGSCRAFCPTYLADNVEGVSARGRLMLLYALSRGDIKPGALINERIYSCTLCGICEAACPVGLDIVNDIYRGRSLLKPGDRKRKHLRFAVGFLMKRPDTGFRVIKPFLPFLRRKGVFPFDVVLPERRLREGKRIFRDGAFAGRKENARARVVLFTGCAVNYLMPSLGRALIDTLLRLGYEVVLPPGEVCCGAPLRAMGLEKEAAEFAKRNVAVFGSLNADAVLSLCPTCTLTIKRDYRGLIGLGIDNALDASEFLANADIGGLPGLVPPANKKVSYHDPCHLAYGLGVRDAPRRILRRLGYEVVEPREPGCCGFGVSLTHDGLSTGLLMDRLDSLSGTEEVVTSCPACMLQLGRKGRRVRHLIELVGDAAGGEHTLKD